MNTKSSVNLLIMNSFILCYEKTILGIVFSCVYSLEPIFI